MKNIFKKVLSVLFISVCANVTTYGQTTNGKYTARTLTATQSKWTYNVAKSESKINGETEDNGIIYIAGAKDKLKVTSSGLSCNNNSSLYLPVPQNAAGTITLEVYSDSKKRWLQLFINGQEGSSQQRLWSREGTDLSQEGPRSYTFSATDLTLKDGKYYLHFKDNKTEMKISAFTIVLTNGSYTGSTPVQKSTDATLKELKYDGTSVAGFDAGKLDYSVMLPANYTGMPNVTATANDSKATLNITQAASTTGKASVLVTAEDGTTTKTYTIQFSQAVADEPVITSFTVAGVPATIDQANKTITATLPIGSSLQGLTPTLSGNNIDSYTPQGAQDFSKPVQYTVKSKSGKTAIYTVTLQVEQPKSSDATLKSLTVGGKAVTLQAGVYNYTVDAESGSAVPQVSATQNDSKATIKITQAGSLTDKATVVVTAEDGTQQTYTITFNIKVPSSDLSIHTPGIYEAEKIAGGYGGTLTAFGGREYEVYYAARNASDSATFNTTGTDRTNGMTTNETKISCEAIDGWFKGTIASISSASASAQDEFTKGTSGREHRMENGHTYTFHFSGYDQFSIYAKDKKQDQKGTKPGDNQYFEVYIDGILQPLQFNKDNYTIRRYSISTGEHVVTVKAINGQCKLLGFSLRVTDEPRVSWIKGNDSTQNVLQTRAMAPVTYYTKYNSKGKTVLEWEGAEATGITLTQGNSDEIGDTLTLSGTANCPVGIYKYKVVAYNQSNQVTNSLNGKITVYSKIEATSDTIQDGFTNEAIDGFTFRYYALSEKDITLVWTNGTPAGITGSGSNGTYTISGTPTTAGVYPFTISVLGGNSIQGKLTVTTFDPGNNPVLYLYKNSGAYEKDGVYLYLKSKGKNLVPRKAQSTLREKAQYDKYTWVLISEDVDANNGEIMALARGTEISMPVLNMKSFSYSESRLDWGDPDNGSLNNKSVRVVQPTHPIIKAIGKKQGDAVQVIDSVVGKGLMPAAVDYQGTLCLATAATRGEEYTADGVEETFLHEVPAAMRGGKKYICFPLSLQSSQRLTSEGQKLIDACVDYLLNSTATIALPKLEIQSFSIDGNAATLYQDKDSICLVMPEGTDLTALTPTIVLSDPTTHTLCKYADENGSVDFSNSNLVPVVYTVSDYINVRHYVVTITAIQPMGVEEVYQAGEWVNIYDIQGRKVATTNEDIYTMDLPRGMYLVQTARGTVKLMR